MRRLLTIVTLVGLLAASTATASSSLRAEIAPQQVASFETVDTRTAATRISATIYCKGAAKTVRAKNVLGQVLWWYRQRLSWCWSQDPGKVAKITSASPRCARTTYGITGWGYWWEFVRHVDCKWDGGVGYGGVTRWRKGHFRYCPIKTGCIQNKFPYAWVTGYVGGTYKTGGGGTS